MKYDILIRNGRIIDPAAGVDAVGDLAVIGNKIVPIEPEEATATCTVDASGCYVLPGLVDIHNHANTEAATCAVAADSSIAYGVTTQVDMGTSGVANFEAFRNGGIAHSATRIKAYLSMYPTGLFDIPYHIHYNVDQLHPDLIRRLKEKYPEDLLGLKIMVSKENVSKGDVIPLIEKTVKIADEIGGLGICVHMSDPACAPAEVACRLRKGDIYCHCYNQKTEETILDEMGKVHPEMWKARERGVLFDAANGFSHYSHAVAKAAIAEGFWPDLIGSDYVSLSLNLSRRNRNLLFLMSKYLHLGMELNAVVAACTATPAETLGMQGKIGTLQPGAFADIAIVKELETQVFFEDSKGKTEEGSRLLVNQMTILDGVNWYSAPTFNL